MESDVSEKIFPEGANESYDEPVALSSGAAQFAYALRGGFFTPASFAPFLSPREYFNA